MVVFLRHKRNGKRYALIGSGINSQFSDENQGLLCVTDQDGQLSWLPVSEVSLETIDGMKVKDLFQTTLPRGLE